MAEGLRMDGLLLLLLLLRNVFLDFEGWMEEEEEVVAVDCLRGWYWFAKFEDEDELDGRLMMLLMLLLMLLLLLLL